MNLKELWDSITPGGTVSVIVIILSLIEITPIKFSPLSWVGKRVNKEVNARMDKMEKGMVAFGGKLDEHIAQSYRNKILEFQDELLDDKKHTKEKFDEVLDACKKYEEHCASNNVENDKVTLAISFIKFTYKKCQENRSFLKLEIKKDYAEMVEEIKTEAPQTEED